MRKIKKESDFIVGSGEFQFSPLVWKTPDTYGENFQELPNSSGLYILLSCKFFPDFEFKIQYVGMSFNLRNRLNGKHPAIDAIGSRAAYFREYPKHLFASKELEFIRHFNPPLNSRGKILTMA